MRIPFYINPDDSHCWQASLKMVIEAFYPRRIFGYPKLDVISAKPEGGWTWPSEELIHPRLSGTMKARF